MVEQKKELAKTGVKVLDKVSFEDVVITREDIKNYLCPKATDKEIYIAMGIMASYKLNPFKREVHLVKYGDAPAEVIVGYETYIKRAERTGKLNGWKAWINKEESRAYVKIFRKDWAEPFEWYIELGEFDKKQATWKQIPDFMGKKVVIAQGFRICFPDELGGMPYTKEEHEVYDIVEEPPKVPQAKEKEPENIPQTPPSTKTLGMLGVKEALSAKENEIITFQGVYQVTVGRKCREKTVYDHTISSREGEEENAIAVSTWESHDELKAGDVVECQKTKVINIKGENKYTAEKIVKIN